MQPKYEQFYEQHAHEGDHNEMLIPDEGLYRARLMAAAEIYQDVCGMGGWLLDVGCGHGGLYEYLNHTDYVGVDMFSHMVERAKSMTNRPVFMGDFVNDRFPFDQMVINFDAVVMLGVFATCHRGEPVDLFDRAFNLSQTVIVSWLDPYWYDGAMESYRFAEIMDMSRGAEPVRVVPPKMTDGGRDVTWTAAWRKPWVKVKDK